MSSVWASAIVLLRVPIRIETATTQAPFRNRATVRGAGRLRPAAAGMQTGDTRAVYPLCFAQTAALNIRANF